MKKNEIIILVIVFLSGIFVSSSLVFFLHNKDITNHKATNVLELDNYTLSYGKYKGIEKEYDVESESVKEKELIIILTKDKINNEIYKAKGNSLFVNNYEMYKVIANNKLLLLAGEGVEFEYVEK